MGAQMPGRTRCRCPMALACSSRFTLPSVYVGMFQDRETSVQSSALGRRTDLDYPGVLGRVKASLADSPLARP
jgi:hypothetical protein